MQAFRSQYSATPGVNQDAARFFSSASSPAPMMQSPSAYDLSTLHHNLPASHSQTPTHAQSPIQPSPLQAGPAAWAADFLQQPGSSVFSSQASQSAQRQGTSMSVEQNVPVMPQTAPNTMMSSMSHESGRKSKITDAMVAGMSWGPSMNMSATHFTPTAGVQAGLFQVKPQIDGRWKQ